MFLEGVRVLDLTCLLPGPYATTRLVDLGADVIGIEPFPNGDPARTMGEQVAGTGVVWLATHRNKHCLQLDLKSLEGQRMIRALIQEVDVLVEGFRPGVADRLGVGYETARLLQPLLIYCSITGYGQFGERSSHPGHDLNYLSASGALSLLMPRNEPPVVPRIPLADHIGGIVASEAIAAALFQRMRTGQGARLDISLTAAIQGLLGTHAILAETNGQDQGCEALSGAVVCYNLYPTRDARLVSLGAIEHKFWESFCMAVGKTEWIPFAFSPSVPENPVYVAVRSEFASRNFAEWCLFADQHGCCVQPVFTPGEVCNPANGLVGVTDLQWENGTIRQVDTHAGGFGQVRPAVTFPTSTRRMPLDDVADGCQSVWESIKNV